MRLISTQIKSERRKSVCWWWWRRCSGDSSRDRRRTEWLQRRVRRQSTSATTSPKETPKLEVRRGESNGEKRSCCISFHSKAPTQHGHVFLMRAMRVKVVAFLVPHIKLAWTATEADGHNWNFVNRIRCRARKKKNLVGHSRNST